MIGNEYTDLFIQHFSFWKHLTDSEKLLLDENATIKKYKKGENLHGRDDNCLGVVLVKKGQLRTYMLSEDGREITLYRLFRKDFCILSASCVMEAITFDVFVDAEEDSEVLLINSSIFHQVSGNNIYVEAFGYKLAATRFSDVMWAMQQILFMGIDKRLAIFLSDEISRQGTDELKLTHEQAAKYMGTAREVVTRMLKYFNAEGIVKLSRGMVKIIDKKKLRAII